MHSFSFRDGELLLHLLSLGSGLIDPQVVLLCLLGSDPRHVGVCMDLVLIEQQWARAPGTNACHFMPKDASLTSYRRRGCKFFRKKTTFHVSIMTIAFSLGFL